MHISLRACLTFAAMTLLPAIALAQFPGQMQNQPPNTVAPAAAAGAAGAPLPATATPGVPTIRQQPALPAGAGNQGNPFAMQLPPPAPDTRIEFQDFVKQSSGRDLPIFGADLFKNVPSTFAPLDNVPVTADYVIGPGDQIVIRAWGQLDADVTTVVDRTGGLNIPKIGTIQVAGVKYQNLHEHIKNAIGRIYRNFELSVSLGQLRSIQVFVVGQARRPGSYTVSSMSTLVNAVFAAGGPAATGSMRQIQLKRGNKVVTELDLYDLLINGDKSKDAALLPGDVIYMPPVGALVAINGSVNVPAIFELKKDGTLADLIGWGGGLANTAAGQKATVERIDNRSVRKVEEFNLDTGAARVGLRDGDLVTIYALSPRIENAVSLRGNVAQPLRAPWRQGMRVRDLIPDAKVLLSKEYWNRRNLSATVSDEAARAATADATQTNLFAQASANIKGLAATATATATAGQANISELIVVNQREVNWDYAVIERVNPRDLTTTLLPFNLGKAVIENDAAQNLLLQPGDVVTVFAIGDIKQQTDKKTKYVRVEGELVTPGIYRSEPGESLRQLVVRVGGLSPNAYLFGAELVRESTRAQQQKNLIDVVDRLEKEMQGSAISRGRNAIDATESATLKSEMDAQQAMIARLRQAKATGRIALGLPAAETVSIKDLPDLVLEDGDLFVVPAKPSTVNVVGSVYGQSAYLYAPGKRVADYLGQAGGLSRSANSADVYVLRADGSVISQRQSGWLLGRLNSEQLMPGDTIVVPEDFERLTWTKVLKDYGQILYQFGLGAAAIKVLKN